jgi:hypothetical protein
LEEDGSDRTIDAYGDQGFGRPYKISYSGLNFLGFLRVLGAITCGAAPIRRRCEIAIKNE